MKEEKWGKAKEVTKTILLLTILLSTGFFISDLFSQTNEEKIASAQVTVKGVDLQIEPAQQTVPVNTPTEIKTIFTVENPEMIKNMAVKGELRGPGINGDIRLSTLPNHPFSIPGLSVAGNYELINIRLEKEGEILVTAQPSTAIINVMDIIVTSVETRPLTLEEIQEKGIVITDSNFTVYNFSVGFLIESEVVNYEFPVVYSPEGGTYIPYTSGGSLGGLGMGGTGSEAIPILFDIPQISSSGGDTPEASHTVAGILIFNNDIAFLNQFFSVMFIITNNAPEGSSLTLKNLMATLSLPEGLREAETNPPHIPGTPIPVHCPGPDGKIGTSDDLNIIMATFNGRAEFLAEGLKQGNHIIQVDFNGTLSGLTSGDVELNGTARGTVIVRNPEFSVTFAHPGIVRSGEEYDLYITLTNTSSVTANLVSLTLPQSRLVGTQILSGETVSFETIQPGESKTAQFHMLSVATGQVRASAFEAEGEVSGKFILTASVGEKGIPLSPDTLVLPGYAYSLPDDLVNSSLLLLGETYCIATTPPGGLPEDIPYITKNIVKTRIIDLSEAGQRVLYEEELLKSVEVLALDWQGNRQNDLSFDILRRLTSKGIKFAKELSKIFSQDLNTNSAIDFQGNFARTCSYKNPFLSAILSFEGNSRKAYLKVRDFYQNELSFNGSQLVRDIPFAEMYLMEDGNESPVDFALMGSVDQNSYKVEISGTGEDSGNFNLSLIVPGAGGGLKQVVFSSVNCQPDTRASLTVTPGSANFVLEVDTDGDGEVDQTLQGSVTDIEEPELQLISAIQDCNASSDGHAVALLFNRGVDKDTAEEKGNYFSEEKEVAGAFLQASERVVIVGFNNPISPFVESKIRISDLKDTKGGMLNPLPTEVVIRTTITTPGGIVYGQVLNAEGTPVPYAKLQLEETEDEGMPIMGPVPISYSFDTADSAGDYQFDYVRILKDAFTIKVLDPGTGKIEEIKSKLRVNGQRLRLDIVMRGRGSVQGRVLQDGVTPVSGAYVSTRVENSGVEEYFGAQTGANGEFLITDVPLGRINLFASKSNVYGSASTALSYPGETVNVDITVVARAVGMVKGRILENDLVTPVKNTSVGIGKDEGLIYVTQTDDEGFFEFSSVPIGSFYVEAVNPLTGVIGGKVTGQLSEGQEINLTIVFRGTGKVSGKVLSYDGIPQPEVLVYISGAGIYTNTDQNGEFVLEGVPVGNYQVIAYNQVNYQEVSSSINIVSEGDEVSTLLVFPDNRTGSISGTLYEPDGTTPAALVSIYISNDNYIVVSSGRSDSNGNFQIDNILPGSYLVVAVRNDSYGVSRATVLAANHVADADVVFRGRGAIQVNVYNSDGTSGVMANVELVCPVFYLNQGNKIGFFSEKITVSTDENGKFGFTDILAGNFSLKAWNGFYPEGTFYSGTLGTNDVLTVDLLMNKNPAGDVKVNVASPEGSPVYNARVTLTTPTLPAMELFTGLEGSENPGYCIFSLVPRGNFKVIAEDQINGYVGIVSGFRGNNEERVEVNLRLRGKGKVFGTVYDNAGENPIPGAKVKYRTIGFPDENFEKITSDQGYFEFPQVSEGNFFLSASYIDLNGSAQGKLSGNNSQTQVDIRMEPTGNVIGNIYEPDSETLISGAQVILYHRISWDPYGYDVSQQDGSFIFESIPLGEVRVEVMDNVSGRQGRATGKLESDGQILNLDVFLEERGTVSGTFYDASKINPISGATVKIKSQGTYPFEMVTTTDAEGNFIFEHISKGSFELTATSPSTGLIGKASGQIEYEDHHVIIDIYAQGSGRVKCQVFQPDGTTLADVSNLNLELVIGTRIYLSILDQDGVTFVFDYIPLNSFSVKAEQQVGRYQGTIQDSLSFHNEEKQVKVVFNGLGTIKGKVYDGSSNPEPDIPVTLQSGGENFSTISDSQGNFEFNLIRMGSFSLVAHDQVNNLSASGSGALTSDGEIKEVDLYLESAGKVTGKIYNEDGTTPAVNVFITLKGNGFTIYNSDNDEGYFEFNAVKIGNFTLECEGYNQSGLARTSGIINTDGEVVNFDSIILDNQKPGVTEIYPPHGSINLPFDTLIQISFSEKMYPESINTANIRLTSNQGNVAGSVTLSADKKSAIFTPSTPLQSFLLYTISVGDSVEDESGNRLEASVSASFTTVDISPPVVASVVPANNSIQTATSSVITVTFNEAINISEFDSDNFAVQKAGSNVNGTITFNDNHTRATFAPTAILEENSSYTVLISGARDYAGNVQVSAFSSQFTTIDTIAPFLQLTPVGGTSVKEGSQVRVIADIGSATDIAGVYFYLNGEHSFSDTVPPYEYVFIAPLIEGSNTGFLLEALAVDRVGNQSPKESINYTLLSDLLPLITVTGPASANIYPGTNFSCSVEASDDVNVTRIVLTAVGGTLNYSNTRNVSGAQVTENYTIPVPSDILPQTQVQIQATAYDILNHAVVSQPVFVQVPQDDQAPQVEITSPLEGTAFDHKDVIQITATASDDIGIKEVSFYLDDQLLSTDSTSPYEATYTVPALPEDKTVVIKAEAKDLAGKVSSNQLEVILKRLLDETDPVIKIFSPSDGSFVFAGENLKIKAGGTDDEGIDKVELYCGTDLLQTFDYSNSETEYTVEQVYAIPADATEGTNFTFKGVVYDLDGKSTFDQVMVQVKSGTILVDGTVINEGDTTYDGQTIIINSGSVTINGSHSFANILVKESGKLTHSGSTTTTTPKMDLMVTGKVVVGVDAKIDTNSRGYLGGYRGDNNTQYGRTLGNVQASYRRSGGSYGGYGGVYEGDGVNEVYGSLYEPSDPGSGGGGDSISALGGNGGGIIRISAADIINDGYICSNGGSTNSSNGAAGAGGSIKIDVVTLSGSGFIQANGGNTDSETAGGGGRIAVYFQDASDFNLNNITAYSGIYTPSSTSLQNRNGSAGTVYLKKQDLEGELIIDNRNIHNNNRLIFPVINPGTITSVSGNNNNVLEDSSANFMIDALKGMYLIPDVNHPENSFEIKENTNTTITVEETVDLTQYVDTSSHYSGKMVLGGHLIIRNTPYPEISRDIEVNNLSVLENSCLQHPHATTSSVTYLYLKVAGKITIDSSSAISANDRGYLGGYHGDNNTQYGRTLGNVQGSYRRSGGSYGGYGGVYEGDAVNEVYGSLYEPSDPGSGGGGDSTSALGGNGGGIIRIEANEMVVDGQVCSNGGNASENGWSGAGSGGSIWLNVVSLKGSGTISANGGNFTYGGYDRAGGGGRVAVYYEDATEFDLSRVNAFGGTYTGGSTSSVRNGGAGTVFLKKEGGEGEIIIDNNGTETSNDSGFIGSSGIITDLEAHKLIDENANFATGSLVGMKLIPNISNPDSTFTIIYNTAIEIFTDPADGDMTLVAQVGDTYNFKYTGNLVFDSSLTVINGTFNFEEITLISADLTVNGTLEVNSLTLQSGSLLTHSPATATQTYSLFIKAESINIDESSSIGVGSRGYLGGYRGDNNTQYGRTLGNVQGSYRRSGGSYGGYGGVYKGDALNEVYGSLYEPSDPGSGGGGDSTSALGGNGGGVLRIEASELLVDGGIGSNGGNASENGWSGAGSGGSIWLNVVSLKGSGTISANGGNFTYDGYDRAGGGGRVAVYYEDATEFDLSRVNAFGGTYTGGSTSSVRNGGAGTVFLKKFNQSYGDLIIDNHNTSTSTGSTTLPSVGLSVPVYSTALEANKLTNISITMIPGTLVGIKLNPHYTGNAGTRVFTIIANDQDSISTDPDYGDMTAYANTGDQYIGEHHLYNIIVKGLAQVFTYDRIQIFGTKTVEVGSSLHYANEEE